MWMQKFSRFGTVWLFCCRHLCWFKAPVDAEAAADDLQLYKLLLAHERISVFKDIFDAALSTSKRHLGYLSEQQMLFARFFHQL